jgi:thiol-disulfide isomerase/thioredoxin
MLNQAWECPRCKRINAPFNPSCFCKKEESIEELAKRVANPLFSFENINEEIKKGRCDHCGGYHGIFQGRAIQCGDLQRQNNGTGFISKLSM